MAKEIERIVVKMDPHARSIYEKQREDIKTIFLQLLELRNVLGRRPTTDEVHATVRRVTGRGISTGEVDHALEENPWVLDKNAKSEGAKKNNKEAKDFQDKELSDYIMGSMSGSGTKERTMPTRAGFVKHLKEKQEKESGDKSAAKSPEKTKETQLTAQTINKLKKDENDFAKQFPKTMERMFKSIITNEGGNKRINRDEYRSALEWATFARFNFTGEKENKLSIQVKLFSDRGDWIDVAKGVDLHKANQLQDVSREDVQRVTDLRMHSLGIDSNRQKANQVTQGAKKEVSKELPKGAQASPKSSLPIGDKDPNKIIPHNQSTVGMVSNDAVDNMNHRAGYLLDFVQKQLGYSQRTKASNFFDVVPDKMPVIREIMFMLRETLGQQQGLGQSQQKEADTRTNI